MRIFYPLSGKKIWVAGHRGMVGQALLRRLTSEDCDVVTAPHAELDLLRQDNVTAWLTTVRPQVIILAAAKVGGIQANDTQPAAFIYENLMIAANVIHAAHLAGVEKLLFLGSSCIYPKHAPPPIEESALLAGPLEPTNQWYAVAKIAGIKLCEAYRRQYGSDFISAMPTNLYGPADNFNLATSHVIPALLRKAHEARQSGHHGFTVWGSGKPRREFLHVDDCADALVHLLQTYSGAEPVNIGSGEDLTIAELAALIARVVGYAGDIAFDRDKPDGTPQKLMSSAKLNALGWSPRIGLEDGLSRTYAWFQEQVPCAMA